MNQYLTQIEIENMNDMELLEYYRKIFNLLAQKQNEVDNLFTLHRVLKNLEREMFKRK